MITKNTVARRITRTNLSAELIEHAKHAFPARLGRFYAIDSLTPPPPYPHTVTRRETRLGKRDANAVQKTRISPFYIYPYTQNSGIRFRGKLRIAGDGEKNGVWFVNEETAERIKVDDTDIVNNNPSELIVVTPNLAAGMYRVEVVTQFTGVSNKYLKEPRIAVFDRVLTAA